MKSVFYKSETTLPYKAQLDPTNEYLIGDDCGNIATERGLKFYVDWLKGQKTGFFVDQRENRALLERYAHDRTVLNMFCYTGGFLSRHGEGEPNWYIRSTVRRKPSTSPIKT